MNYIKDVYVPPSSSSTLHRAGVVLLIKCGDDPNTSLGKLGDNVILKNGERSQVAMISGVEHIRPGRPGEIGIVVRGLPADEDPAIWVGAEIGPMAELAKT